MNPQDTDILIAEALGWVFRPATLSPDQLLASQDGRNFYAVDIVPSYRRDLNALAAARDQLINTPELRIRWVNTMRDVVGRTCTRRNKLGHPIVSDIDLLFATPEQLAETLVLTLKLKP